jgi:esterase/lipase superfamily enzyme
MIAWFKTRSAAALALAFAGLFALAAPGAAQTSRIEKEEGKSLTGSAYARLRSLSYEQCEARCLREPQCVAFEHYRGGGIIKRSSNCALFSVVTATRVSRYSDVGYKRTSVAEKDTRRSPKVALPKDGARTFDGTRPTARAAPPPASDVATVPPPAVTSPSARRSAPPPAAPQPTEPAPAAPAPVAPGPTARPRAVIGTPPSPAEPAPAAPLPRVALPGAGSTPEIGASPTTRGAGGTVSGTGAPPSGEGAARSVTPALPPGTAPPPAPAAEATDKKFHVVPVFYGTDRNRSDKSKRIAYGNDRARRLELGQALITVPLNHKVPNIERPSAWTLPWIGTIWQEAEDPARHFTVQKIEAKTRTEMLALIKQRLQLSSTFKDQSIVFIHGYNVGFDDALYRTAQITFDLQFDGASFTYSWPSGSGWTSYPYDQNSAQQAEPYLYQFLQMVQTETGTKQINIIAHSMGNQLLLQVLRELKRRSPGVSTINQIVLAAPDVDRDTFEFLAGEISGIAKGITLYASGNDRALEASRLFAGNRPRAGDVPKPPEGPVVVAGIDTIDITGVSTDYLFALRHSDYAEHSELLTDINHLIRTGLRPPNLRINRYELVNSAGGAYWRYQGN